MCDLVSEKINMVRLSPNKHSMSKNTSHCKRVEKILNKEHGIRSRKCNCTNISCAALRISEKIGSDDCCYKYQRQRDQIYVKAEETDVFYKTRTIILKFII